MKKKLLLIPTIFALASCSYGGITKVSNDAFKTFYNSGDLHTQKDFEFNIGNDISVSRYLNDENSTHVYYDLTTSAIDKWNTDGFGNKLSFYLYEIVSSLDDEEVYEMEYRDGSLSFASRVITEEGEEEGSVVVAGRKDTYNSTNIVEYGVNGESYTDATSYGFISIDKELSSYYEALDEEGKEFDTDYLYRDYNYTFNFKVKSKDTDETSRVTHEQISSLVIQYREYFSGNKSNLNFVENSSIKETTELKEGGTYVGSSRVVDEIDRTTTLRVGGSSEMDVGKSIIAHTEYIYSEGSYQKDEEHSSRTEDDTYRYSLAEGYKDGFAVTQLLEDFTTNSNILTVIDRINDFMSNIFIAFEGKMNDEQEKKEIIHFGDTYQYRIEEDTTHIYQCTFVDGEGEKDRLTNIIIFEVGSDKSLTEISKTSIIY